MLRVHVHLAPQRTWDARRAGISTLISGRAGRYLMTYLRTGDDWYTISQSTSLARSDSSSISPGAFSPDSQDGDLPGSFYDLSQLYWSDGSPGSLRSTKPR
jgi:hypothetical protein